MSEGLPPTARRRKATEGTGQIRIETIVRSGTLLDAHWYSFGVNKTHGLRRTNDDKHRAVLAALEHDLGKDRSAGAIAKHCGVTQQCVSKIRQQATAPHNNGEVTKHIGKDGKARDVSGGKNLHWGPVAPYMQHEPITSPVNFCVLSSHAQTKTCGSALPAVLTVRVDRPTLTNRPVSLCSSLACQGVCCRPIGGDR